MKTYDCKDAPIKVCGIPFFESKKAFERLPLEFRSQFANLEFLGRCCPGARICFRTNAQEFKVKVSLKTLKPDVGMSIYSCQSVSVMIGERQNSFFAGLLSPPDYNTKVFEKTFTKCPQMEDVTLWLVRNEELDSVEISIPDDAQIEEPTSYKYGPALYYGSSITEGGCASNVTNNYVALLSRWLDLDYYNFGFSGNAFGELEMADYINTIDFNVFVYDYDHNTPTIEHLKKTHEPFFMRIREKKPDVPILMFSRPNFEHSADAEKLREVIEQTYTNAVQRGDKNVYYLDGETFFGSEDRQLCTIDQVHPNDLGFYRMAKMILPVMREMLKIRLD